MIKVTHDGRTNKYSFMIYSQKIIFAPLNPSEVREDKKLREEYEKEKREKEKENNKFDKKLSVKKREFSFQKKRD